MIVKKLVHKTWEAWSFFDEVRKILLPVSVQSSGRLLQYGILSVLTPRKKNRNYKLDFSSTRIILICQVPKVEEMSKIFLGISCLKSRLRNVTKTKNRLIRDTLISIQKKKPLEHWTTFCQSKLLFLRFSIRNCFVHVLEMGCIQQPKNGMYCDLILKRNRKDVSCFYRVIGLHKLHYRLLSTLN